METKRKVLRNLFVVLGLTTMWGCPAGIDAPLNIATTGTLRGSVTRDGAPAVGVTVEFTDSDGVKARVTTVAGGNYEAMLPIGVWDVSVLVTDAVCVDGIVSIVENADETRDLACETFDRSYQRLYTFSSETCGQGSASPHTAMSTASGTAISGGVSVAFDQTDIPVLITGFYGALNRDLVASTGPVDIQSGFEQNETWEMDLDYEFGETNFSVPLFHRFVGNSTIEITSGGVHVCERVYDFELMPAPSP